MPAAITVGHKSNHQIRAPSTAGKITTPLPRNLRFTFKEPNKSGDPTTLSLDFGIYSPRYQICRHQILVTPTNQRAAGRAWRELAWSELDLRRQSREWRADLRRHDPRRRHQIFEHRSTATAPILPMASDLQHEISISFTIFFTWNWTANEIRSAPAKSDMVEGRLPIWGYDYDSLSSSNRWRDERERDEEVRDRMKSEKMTNERVREVRRGRAVLEYNDI